MKKNDAARVAEHLATVAQKAEALRIVTTPGSDQAATVTAIATIMLGITTLETRHNDHLDFYDLGVWSIKAALDAAYQAGRSSK